MSRVRYCIYNTHMTHAHTHTHTVVGDKEMTSKTVNVRTRDNVVHGEKTVQQLLDHMKKLKTERSHDDDSSEF